MCTGIIIRTKDGKIIFGRTLEFGLPLRWKKYSSNKIKGTVGSFPRKREYYMRDGGDWSSRRQFKFKSVYTKQPVLF